MDVALGKPPKAYKNIYFIRALNPGDRIQYFCSFRYTNDKKDCVICRVDIDLEKPEGNVVVGLSYLLPFKTRMRESFTFFRKSFSIANKSIAEIITQTAVPLIAGKIIKLEGKLHGPD